MKEVQFVDTTLRDGQASLWAENMRTGMLLAVAERIDNAGYHAIEVIASSHIKKCVRELRENPFERMRLVAQKIKKTTLRAIGAERISAFELSPDSVVDLWFERLLANGMRQLRISDPYGYMQFPHGGILPGVGLRLWHSLPMVVKPRGKTYRRPIVVLIDTTTVSSAELLTMGLKDLCDATLVGHHTAGASAGVLEVTLPDGLKVSYSAFPTRRLDNRTYQYVGIAPDVEFEVNRARICREGWIGVMTQHADEVTKAREIAAAKAKLWSGE